MRTKVFVGGGLLAIAVAAILIWQLKTSPVAVVKNSCAVPVAVRLLTDVGETYSAGTIPAGGSARIRISGRDKLLWAESAFPDGKLMESARIYTTTQGTVTIDVNPGAVGIDYAL